MNWLCTDLDGSASERIVKADAAEAVEAFAEAIHTEDPEPWDRRRFRARRVDVDGRPDGDPIEFVVHLEWAPVFSAYQD